ncbi:MAG TPA: hypothetical protein VG389_13295 [Myxococcota bacterium]|jgi:hypothetical protein|nr:hypothetical protein [Myxococcota bacterium]
MTRFVAAGSALASFAIVLACFGTERADAVAIARGVGASCAIDNDDSPYAEEVYLEMGTYYNSANEAYLECNLPSGTAFGLIANDVDWVTAYVYWGDVSYPYPSATLSARSPQNPLLWDSCATLDAFHDGVNGSGSGNYMLSWSGLDAAGTCTDHDWALFLRVELPSTVSYSDNGFIGWLVWDDD